MERLLIRALVFGRSTCWSSSLVEPLGTCYPSVRTIELDSVFPSLGFYVGGDHLARAAFVVGQRFFCFYIYEPHLLSSCTGFDPTAD